MIEIQTYNFDVFQDPFLGGVLSLVEADESGRNAAPPLPPIWVQYLNNIVEQDHRAIKRCLCIIS